VQRLLLSACALRFFDSFLLIVPFYTVMFAERGLTPTQIGVVLASWSVIGLVLEVPCGVLADRFPRRWLLALAQLLRAGGLMVWILWPGFWGFLIGLMLWGLKSATFNGAFEAVVYDELKAVAREPEYARVMGRTQAARAGGVVGASLAAAAVAPLGYPALIAASVAACFAAAASALALPSAPRALPVGGWGYFRHLKRGVSEAASLPGVPSLLLFIAGMQAVTTASADYWQLFGREVGLPKPGIALFIAALAATGMSATIVAHRLRGLSLRALCALLVAAGASLTLAAAAFQAWSVGLVLVYVGLYWLVDVNADARFQHALRPETRATVASVKGFVMQAGTSLLMLAYGMAADAASYRAAFLGAGLLTILVGSAYGLSRRPQAA
jgi:MFS family permease